MDLTKFSEAKFGEIFEKAKANCVELQVELVGNRPCMSNDMNMEVLNKITCRAKEIQGKHFGIDVIEKSGSTDCNIPHSLGIPAIALANYSGGGAHTREEWVIKDSFKQGLRVSMELILTEGGLM